MECIDVLCPLPLFQRSIEASELCERRASQHGLQHAACVVMTAQLCLLALHFLVHVGDEQASICTQESTTHELAER